MLTDPNYEVAPTGCFRCKDCGRTGARPGSALKHARSCDLFPNQLAGPKVQDEAEEKGVAAVHAGGVCTWTKEDGRWVVTGPEQLLRAAQVMVQAKGKPAEQIEVTNLRQVDGRWIADKRRSPSAIQDQVSPVSDDAVFEAFRRGEISMSDAMNRDF